MEKEKSRELLRQWMNILSDTENVYTAFLKRFHVNKNTFFALDHLNSNPEGEEPAVLAERLGLTRQMMTIGLNDLDERGFIIRRERKDDHRRKTILLSKKGKTFADEICRASENFDLTALAGFSDEEFCGMLDFSKRFYEKIKAQLENAIEREDPHDK